MILEISLRLSKIGKPNLAYKDLQNYFAGKSTDSAEMQPTLEQIRKAVIEIRDKKYPFPKIAKNGSVGSFFKNSFLREKEYRAFEQRFTKSFGVENLAALRAKVNRTEKGVKIPTAFLIEQCGLKGLSNANVMVNEKQPLVLLNKGNAKAKDVLKLASQIADTVRKKTGLKLEIEPELVGFPIKK